MGILGRYVIKEILKIQMPLWLSLGFFIFLLEYMAASFSQNVDAGVQFLMYFYKLPSHLQLVFPISVLFAFLLVFGHMSKSLETVAAQSFGYSKRRIFIPALIAMVLASIPFYFVTNYLAPTGHRAFLTLYDTHINKAPSDFGEVKTEKIWHRNQDVLYTISFFKPETAELFGLTLYTFDQDFHIAQAIVAERAQWQQDHWMLYDGKVYVTDKKLRSPAINSFERRKSRLIEEPSKLTRVQWTPKSMTQSELWRAISHSKSLGINTAAWETTYHSRWSFFAVAFVFMMLAFPRVTRFHRGGGAAKDGVFVAAVCLAYWLIFNFGVNLGNSGRLSPVVAAWAPTLIFVVAVFIYNRSLSLKSLSQ